MHGFSTKTRLAFGLACLLVSAMMLAQLLGMIPERRQDILHGRAMLCEAVAIENSGLVGRVEPARLERTLQLIVERNSEMRSAALRRADGRLLVEVGDHRSLWRLKSGEQSTEECVQVPLRSGRQKWGSIEFCFQPIHPSGLKGLLNNPAVRLIVFVASLSFLLYWLYLRKMLEHLDPSKAVPSRVRSALDTLAEGLVVMDNQERILLANQAFASLVGEPPEKLLGRRVSKFAWQSETGDPVESHPWQAALAERKPQLNVSLRLPSAAGTPRTFMVNCAPVLGQDGKYRGVLASFDDVTVIETQKLELGKSKEAAEAANRAKSDFLANMSHEIRTPMNAILGFADILRRGLVNEETERQAHLNTIHASGTHLLGLINDILDLSKVEAGRLQVELAPCSPHETVFQVIDTLAVRARERGLDLEFKTDTPIPATIQSDPTRLRQILTNLVGNAIKFTERGGVTIVARLESRRNPRLTIEVRDTGIGMSPEVLGRIFDPFVQADTSITRRFGGTGLGLTISRRFAEALGGSLTVRSTPGQGSTFALTVGTGALAGVEMLDAGRAEKDWKQRQAAAGAAAEISLPPARVLIADDGEANRQLLELILRRAGMHVVAVENGRQAVEQAVSTSFDLILLDMQMPVMDGYSAAAALRKAGIAAPIVALTADAMQGSEARCRQAGCSAFLTKPLQMDRLLRCLEGELGKADGMAASPVLYPDESRRQKSRPAPQARATRQPLVSTLPMDDDEFREIVRGFAGKLREQLQAMHAAAERRDYQELARLAHWLKGAGGTMGFADFHDPARRLEESAAQRRQDLIEPTLAEIAALAGEIVIPEQYDGAPVPTDSNCVDSGVPQ